MPDAPSKQKLDRLDKQLIRWLKADGRISTARLAEKLSITSPTVRSRLKALIQAGALKITAIVNPARVQDLTVAIIGIDIESRGKLESQLKQISQLPQVHWAAVVTGRFDIIAEVAVTGGVDDLFQFTSKVLPTIGKVTHCETFVVMRSERKWIYPPESVAHW